LTGAGIFEYIIVIAVQDQRRRLERMATIRKAVKKPVKKAVKKVKKAVKKTAKKVAKKK
jgi:hypothetical protein